MKTVIALSLCGLCLAACERNKAKPQPVDEETRTTSAIIVEPTLHDGHAAEPQKTETEQNYEPNPPPMDRIDQEPVEESRDGG